MDGDVGALACGEQAVELGGAGAVVGDVDAAHGVVVGRADGHGVGDHVDTLELECEVADLGQALHDLVGAQVAHVEHHVALHALAKAAALLDLSLDGACDEVARAELHLLGCVALHEALALVVDEVAALAAAGLGQERAAARKSRGVELDHLGVLDGHARPHRRGDAVAGHVRGVGRAGPVDAPKAAGAQDDALGLEGDDLAGAQVDGDEAGDAVFIGCDVEQVELVVEDDVVLQAVLVERVEDDVAGLVLRVAAARVACAAKGTLCDAALVVAGVGDAHALELEDQLRHAAAEELDGVLVCQVVGALDRVEDVALNGVGLIAEAERGVHAALSGAGVAAGGEHLGDDGNGLAAVRGGVERRLHAGASGAYDDDVVLVALH